MIELTLVLSQESGLPVSLDQPCMAVTSHPGCSREIEETHPPVCDVSCLMLRAPGSIASLSRVESVIRIGGWMSSSEESWWVKTLASARQTCVS
jgi:hypothetical protein